MTTLPSELEKRMEEMAEKYALAMAIHFWERLPPYGPAGDFKSKPTKGSIRDIDVFQAGFNAAYELMSKEIKSMDDKLKGMACEHNDVSLDLIEERAKSQKLIEALESIARETGTPYGDEASKALAEYRGEVTKLQVPEIEELNKQLAKDRKNV